MNRPRPARPISEAEEVPASLREGAVLILREAQAFQGVFTATGDVRMQNGRIEFTAPKQPPFDIRYRLPGALASVPQYKGAADLSVIEQSDPGGPDRQVLLRTGGALLFAAILTKSQQPNRLEIARGASIMQLPVDVNEKSRGASARVQARDVSGTVTMIPVGQVTSVRIAGVALDVFIKASYRSVKSPKEQHAGGYVLEGWVVRPNQP